MSSVSDNLFGAYTHKLDPKNRIAIPAEWRPTEGCALLLLSGRRLELPTVKAYTREKFQQLIDKKEATPGYTEAQIDDMYAKGVTATMDPRETAIQWHLKDWQFFWRDDQAEKLDL